MAQEPGEFIPAPYRIDNPEGGPAFYGVGDPVPYEHAVELGLAAPKVEEKPKPKRRAKKAAGNTAKKPAEDRAKKPSEDR